MAATIRRAFYCEAEIVGRRWNEETLGRAIDALKKDFAPISDMRASADYRLQATQNLLRRFYLESRGEFTQTVYSYGRQD
jgi:xanthine dehydrogenase small subunit